MASGMSDQRQWVCVVVAAMLCLTLNACEAQLINDEIDEEIKICNVTDSETYMVDVVRWFREYESVWHTLFPCWGLRDSLESWRETNGNDWGFLDNPGREGPVPSLRNARAFGMQYWNGVSGGTIVVDLDSGSLGSSDVGAWSFEYPEDFTDLSENDIEKLGILLTRTTDTWPPVPGWPEWQESSADPAADSIVMAGWSWQIVVCADDYGIYRFQGKDAVTEGFLELVDAVHNYV